MHQADTLPAPILIPIDQIDEAALHRDRTLIDAESLDELRSSLARSGLRAPIEVFPLPDPRPPHRYGLISGLRRLTAFRELHRDWGQDRWAAIPAFVREPVAGAEALAAVVEENELRAGLSPWERGHIAWRALAADIYPTLEAAVEGLYPDADRHKRARYRALGRLVQGLSGILTDPEDLSMRQCLRIERALRMGYEELIVTTLEESPLQDAENQWRMLQPILREAEEESAQSTSPNARPRVPGRPIRVQRPRRGLTVRRERTDAGWCLHFEGREATSDLIDVVFFEIERIFNPQG